MIRQLPFLLFLAFALLGCSPTAKEKERHANNKRLELLYDKVWFDCVEELGMERCRLIQEAGLWRCRGFEFKAVNGNGRSGIEGCAEDRFLDRIEVLPAPAEEDTTQPPTNPEASQ